MIYDNRKEKLDQLAESYEEGQRSRQCTSHEGWGFNPEGYKDGKGKKSKARQGALKQREIVNGYLEGRLSVDSLPFAFIAARALEKCARGRDLPEGEQKALILSRLF